MESLRQVAVDFRDALDRGEAAFTVRHDASDPFRVNVGDAR